MNKKLLISVVASAMLTLSASAAGFAKTNTYTDGLFADVPATEWYAAEVKNTYELGLMNGTGAGVFNPDGNVTVAEAVTMAARAASIYSGDTIAEAEGEWYAKYVAYAETKGFVKAGQFDNFDRAAKRYEVHKSSKTLCLQIILRQRTQLQLFPTYMQALHITQTL